MAKKMKKLLALVLTVAMVLSFMSVGAFAAEGEGSEGAETEPATYTVTYAYDETAPEGAVVPVDENEYEEGDAVELVEPASVDGYTFNGWDKEDNFTMPAEDVVITGSWTVNEPVPQTTTYTVTVKYVDEDGETIAGDYVSDAAEADSAYDVSDQIIDVAGYEYKSTDGDVTGTLDGDKVITVTYTKIPVKEALDLTAVAEASGEGWTWADGTLTLNGATIDSSKDDVPAPAIKLPDGATIVVNGVNTIHASDDQNGITCAGALTIQGSGTLNVSCYDAVYASSISITGVTLNISGYRYGIYAYNGDSNASSVVLTNCTGICQADYYSGICAYSASGDAYVKLDNCDNLTVKSNGNNPNSGSVNHYYSGIRVYNVGATADATLEIVNCDNLYVSGSQDGMLVDAHANGQTTASGQAAVTITNSSVTAESATTVYSAIFVNNYGDTTDATSTITIQNSTVDGLAPNSVGIMTSTKNAASTVNVIDSTVAVSGKGAGVRMISKGGQYSSAAMSENSLLVVLTEVSAGAIDDTNGENAAKDGYTLNDTSKIVTATEGSITANGDGTFAIAKGSEVTAEYAAESVDYTFYMQAGGVDANRDIWGYDTFSKIDWTADEIIIYTEDELHEFALITQGKHPLVAQRDFAGQTVKLGADIALRDYWYHRDAQGNVIEDHRIAHFKGFFDGNGYIISDLKYLDKYAAATAVESLSFFRYFDNDSTLKNIVIVGITANTVAPARFSGLVDDGGNSFKGLSSDSLTENCTVKNITVNATNPDATLVFAGMFGRLLGSPEVKNCHVENFKVNAAGALNNDWNSRSGGFLATGAEGGSQITDCSVTNLVVNAANGGQEIGGFVGGTGGATYTNCDVNGFAFDANGSFNNIGGFAGRIAGNGWDKNLIFTDCDVSGLNIDAESVFNVGGFIGYTAAGINDAKDIRAIENCSAEGIIKAKQSEADEATQLQSAAGFIGKLNASLPFTAIDCVAKVNVTSTGNASGFVVTIINNNNVSSLFTGCTASGDVFGKEPVNSFLDADETTVDGIIGGTYNYDPENVDTETGETNNVADGYRALDNGDGTWTVFPDNGKEVVKVAFHRWNDKLNNYENWRTVEVFKDVDFFEAAHNNALNCSHPDYRFSNGIAELDEEADDKTEQVFGFWADAPDSTKLVLDNEIEVLADMNVYAVYGDFVCEIVETGVKYLTLTAAVADANALGTATIQMLKSIDFDSTKALAITGNVTIIGEHTISRGDYTGTMFSVAKNATLTLDGGLVIDGGNNWTFDSANYYADMAAGKTLSTGAKNSYTTSNGIVATAAMITISGTNGAVVMNRATIQNNWADNHNGGALFSVPAGATLTMNDGALIQHIRGSVAGQIKGTWTMNDGKIDDVYGHNTNGALVDIRGGTFTINGGEITNVRTLGLNANGNGILAQVYGESSKLNINGGYIHDNDSFSPGNGWGSVVYLNRGGDFTMTGGTIKATKSDHCTAFVSNAPTSIELLGGTIEVDPSMANWFDSLFYGNVTVAEGMEIVGTEDAFFCMLGDTQYTLDIDGQISGGTIWLMHNVPVTGNGTITSDVLVKADPDYFGFDGKVTVTETTKWLNSLITVDSVGSDAFLTVDSGVVIDGVQVRVLGSVASGEYTNAGESAAEQTAAYIEQTGATVESPVLFYHRLTSAQKSDIVVTFDYNGGLDAQNWSGCQITSAEAFAPTCPVPTKDGYVLIGWKYAVDNDPESLSMAGTADYAGETIAQSVRLIAQWGRECTVTYVGYYGNEMQTLTAKTGDAVPEYSGWMVPVRFPDGNYYYTFRGWNLTEGTLGADGKVGITDLVYTATFDAHEIEDIFTPFFPTGDDDDTGNNETVIDDEQVPLAGIPAAFREDHIAYIIGRDDGLVHPEANITRAEVAMIFYRLLNDETRELYTTTESYFPDVTENDWYCAAVSTLNAMGIILGKPDGTFAPNAYITRAEFAAIAARFDPTASTEGGFFTDIDGHWAELEINMAANNGWVEGFNGLFRPDENITRAEAMTMVNRVLLRMPESVEDLLDGMIVWADNMDPNKWYYLAVQEATNGHDYERKESGYEHWTALED